MSSQNSHTALLGIPILFRTTTQFHAMMTAQIPKINSVNVLNAIVLVNIRLL
jgi:hypothetical protein